MAATTVKTLLAATTVKILLLAIVCLFITALPARAENAITQAETPTTQTENSTFSTENSTAQAENPITQVVYVNLLSSFAPSTTLIEKSGQITWYNGSSGFTLLSHTEEKNGTLPDAQVQEFFDTIKAVGYHLQLSPEGIEPKLMLIVYLADGTMVENFAPSPFVEEEQIAKFKTIEAFIIKSAASIGGHVEAFHSR